MPSLDGIGSWAMVEQLGWYPLGSLAALAVGRLIHRLYRHDDNAEVDG
jgi:hypothetical protein